MGGKTWSEQEERFFWEVIVPQSPKAVIVSDQEKDWQQCAALMQEEMGVDARRKYTKLMLFEHYFQNIKTGSKSPHARQFVGEHVKQLRLSRLDEKQAEREEDSFGASSSPSPRTMPRVTSRRAVRNTATFAAAVPSPKGRPRPYSDTADRGSPDPTFATYQPPVYRKTGREHAPQVLRSELDGERHLLRSSEHAPIAQMSTVPSYTKEATAEPVDGFIEEFDDDDDDDDEYQEPRPRRPIFIKRTRPHQTVNYATEVSGSPIRQSGDTYTKSIFATPAWERVPKRQSTNTPESHRKRPRYLH